MEFLHELIQSLTPAEVKGVRAELKLRKKNTQLQQTFEDMLKVKDRESLPDLFNNLQGINNQRKLHSLESRLQELILDYLVSDENLNRNKEIEELDKARFTIRRKMNHYSYLTSYKNHLQINLEVLNEIIALSKKFEYYYGIIEGLQKKKQYLAARRGLSEYYQLETEIDYYKECNDLCYLAEGYYTQINSTRIFYTNNNNERKQNLLKGRIAHLRERLGKINSFTAFYFLHLLELEYYKNEHNYHKIKELSIEKLNLLKHNKGLYHQNRLGITFDELATSEIMLGNYEQAISYAKTAEEYFLPKSYNYWSSKGFQLLALFYCKRYNEAEIIIDLVLQEKKSISKYKYSTFLIFKAYTLFARQNFKQALKVLSQPLELTSDKTGWDITVRVLTIMTLTELGHLDEATQHIDRLRKHVERYSKKDFVTDRNITITNLLRTLARHEFNFKHPSLDRYLRQLRSPEQAWKPLTPELIPVEVWVKK